MVIALVAGLGIVVEDEGLDCGWLVHLSGDRLVRRYAKEFWEGQGNIMMAYVRNRHPPQGRLD